jgi:hypothetical protein
MKKPVVLYGCLLLAVGMQKFSREFAKLARQLRV